MLYGFIVVKILLKIMVLMKRTTSISSNPDEVEKALPYAYGASTKQPKFPNRSTDTKKNIVGWFDPIFKGIIIIGIIVFAITTYTELGNRKMELSLLREDYQKLEISAAEVEGDLLSNIDSFGRLEENIKNEGDPSMSADQVTNAIIARQEAMVSRVETLQREVQRLHRQQVLDR